PPHCPSPTLFPYTTLFRSGIGKGISESRASWRDGNSSSVALHPERRRGSPLRTLRSHLGIPRPSLGITETVIALINTGLQAGDLDRKSTRLNSSHVAIAYA